MIATDFAYLYFVCIVFHLIWMFLLVCMFLFLYFSLSFMCLYYHSRVWRVIIVYIVINKKYVLWNMASAP